MMGSVVSACGAPGSVVKRGQLRSVVIAVSAVLCCAGTSMAVGSADPLPTPRNDPFGALGYRPAWGVDSSIVVCHSCAHCVSGVSRSTSARPALVSR